MTVPILYDLSEFLASLLRSGIQRVVFQITRHWPVKGQLVPFRVDDAGQMYVLPPRVFDLMAVYFGAAPGNPKSAREGLWRLARLGRRLSRAELSRYGGLLEAEVFFHVPRVRFYEQILRSWGSDRIFFLVYDLLPWLRPEWFSQFDFPLTIDYLRLLRQVKQVSFISEQTRQDYLHRLLRTPRDVGPALALGADALGLARPQFDRSRRHFAVLGTIEPRKNHLSVLDAFERLWAEGVEAELSFVGRLGWINEEGRKRLEKARQQPRFHWIESAGDADVVRVVRTCRATIYPSHGEGFGLPPLESLGLGVPVIVTGSLPSVQMIKPFGQVRLEVPDAESVYQGVRTVLDDTQAARLHQEIDDLSLPTWAGMGQQMAAWVNCAPRTRLAA